MDNKHYEYLVRSLELDAEANPAVFRSRVVLVSAAAYVALAVTLALAAVLAALGVHYAQQSGRAFLLLQLGLAGLVVLGILYTVLRAFLTRLGPPEGREITRAEAPRLFELLDRIRGKLAGPPIDRVVIDRQFNAAIAQVPRFGLFGGHRNHLVLGLPYLYAMSPRETAATLAHEYGHLAGAHGKLGAWVYRQRLTFGALMDKVRDTEGNWLNGLLHAGLRRFAPYFNAYTFVLSRQDEYQADTVASQVAGADANASGLCRGELIGRWIAEEFWPRLYAQADTHPQPLFMPYSAMRTAFSATYADWSTEARLQGALQRKSDLHDTHPCLRERLDAIGQAPALPPPVAHNAADALLGPLAATIAREFDAAWWSDARADWQAHYRERRDHLQTIAELGPRPPASLSPFEAQELGSALMACERAPEARPVFEHLLARSDGPFPRARMMYGQLLVDADDARGVEELARAAKEDPRLAQQCAEYGYVFLRQAQGGEAAAQWADEVMRTRA